MEINKLVKAVTLTPALFKEFNQHTGNSAERTTAVPLYLKIHFLFVKLKISSALK